MACGWEPACSSSPPTLPLLPPLPLLSYHHYHPLPQLHAPVHIWEPEVHHLASGVSPTTPPYLLQAKQNGKAQRLGRRRRT